MLIDTVLFCLLAMRYKYVSLEPNMDKNDNRPTPSFKIDEHSSAEFMMSFLKEIQTIYCFPENKKRCLWTIIDDMSENYRKKFEIEIYL